MTEQERIYKLRELTNNYIDPHVIDTLQFLGFFTAPAAIKHHGNYEGGLFDHSFAVAEHLDLLTKALGLRWQREGSPWIVGILHDLCKIDNYMKDETGVWKYNNKQLINGHGEKSVIMAQQYMALTVEEMMCIRWHMGAFDDKEHWQYYTRACRKYPNVLYTHTADMYASQILGV